MPRRPGPEPKGDREPITARLPRAHLARYRAEAAALQLPLTDYLALVLARTHGLDTPAYLDAPSAQAALPIAG